MKKLFVCMQLCIIVSFSGYTQTYSFGASNDSLIIELEENCILPGGAYHFCIYKPINYDSLNSPILWYIHGSGGSGTEGLSILQETSERRNALIVSPTMHTGMLGWAYVSDASYDTITGCATILWSTQILKQIYRHILIRENRGSIPVYLTGFSQGGQFVTRYMLVRQFDPDSIPIAMSASVDPANYTLCTDTFDGSVMNWKFYRCGLAGESPIYNCNSIWTYTPVNTLICNSHVKQYYNENYAVLIGTNDTVDFPGFCPNQGGDDRYERAIAFYNFSDTNAVNRGTTLQWQYAEIPDIGHDGYALYNTVAAGDSIPIAERVLFETPWHPVPDFSPVADFFYNNTGLTVHVIDNSINADNWDWDFGDGFYSNQQNLEHTYSNNGTYTICLSVGNSCISDISCANITITSVGINSSDEISNLKVYPNPFRNTATIELTDDSRRIDIDFTIYDQIGREVKTYKLNKPKTIINSNDLKKGIYYYEAHNNYNYKIFRGKLLIID
ncbi:MAG TPA: PKD domain-containing protein [Bacteroidales bacterium]|nr:PKD domain-containing protein [Bacteroidales bacterium]